MAKVVHDSMREQVRRNSVALISLVVAVTSLSYNTWRNEATEYNRNQRTLSVQVLLKLGELQELVNYRHYEPDAANRGNLKTGWAIVNSIRDLSLILQEPLPDSAARLHSTWEAHSDRLGENDASVAAIRHSIEATRDDTLALLQSLD